MLQSSRLHAISNTLYMYVDFFSKAQRGFIAGYGPYLSAGKYFLVLRVNF